MSQTYRNNDVQRVLDATDIVRLIGEYVTLRPAGREFKGLCPFHDDTNPSMSVVPHKGIFHCFACGTGGDALRFIRLHQHVEFREALKFLAERAGIEITPWRPDRGGEEGPAGEHDVEAYSTAEIVEAHQQALSFYRLLLRHEKHGTVARELFAARGISEAMVERFELGTAPTDPEVWDGLARTLARKGYGLDVYQAVGLLLPRRDGEGCVDRFRNRLIFPIHDEHGRPIAFGARKIDPDDEPKYLNSPEHPRFKKSRTLYGLHLARPAIQKSRAAAIVEGYTDVIACHQHGIENVVATLGTALTADHARLLARICERVILVFDGDAAGQKAADRAVEVFFESPIDVRIAVLPGGLDPAELFEQPGGVETWSRCMAEAVDALDFLFAALRAKLSGAGGGVSARQRIIEAFLTRLGSLGFHHMTPLRRDLMLARLSEMVQLPRETLLASIPRPRPRGAEASSPEPAPSDAPPPLEPRRIEAEMRLVACLLHEPALLDGAPEAPGLSLAAEDLAWPPAQRIFAALHEQQGVGGSRRRGGVPAGLDAALADAAVAWMMRLDREVGEAPQAVAEHFVHHLRALHRLRQVEEYHAQASAPAPGDEGLNMERARERLERLRALGGSAVRFARAAKAAAAGEPGAAASAE